MYISILSLINCFTVYILSILEANPSNSPHPTLKWNVIKTEDICGYMVKLQVTYTATIVAFVFIYILASEFTFESISLALRARYI